MQINNESMKRIIICLSVAVFIIASDAVAEESLSGWGIYRNEKMGFEIRYPKSWYVRLSKGTMESIALSKKPLTEQPTIYLQFIIQRGINPKNLSINEWYSKEVEKLEKYATDTPPITITQTFIGQRSAVLREYIGKFGKNYDFYIALKNKDIFQISIIQSPAHKVLSKEIEDILATIQFLVE